MLDKENEKRSAEELELAEIAESDDIQQKDIITDDKVELAEESSEVGLLKKQSADLQQTIKNMQDSVSGADDKVLRAHAEMENIRRRSQKDVESARKFALEKFANDLLPIIDSMEKATEIAVTSDEGKAMSEGVELTLKMLVDTLKKFGIVQINPVDAMFDPNQHEAMAMAPNAEKENNMIMDVFQKGYLLNQRVIRPARVVVVKNQ